MDTAPRPDLARVAAIIGEPARAAMLEALLSGQALPAGELARRAGVRPSTASEHLARLVENGLVVRRVSGRHRYYALADADVAAALEALARIAPPARPGIGPVPERVSRTGRVGEEGKSPAEQALRFARTCYDHLAGTLGVLLTDTLLEKGFIAGAGFEVTTGGEAWLRSLDIDVDALRRAQRALSRPCLDWSERRDHLAGAVGAAIAGALIDRGWLVRIDGTRALRLTVRGRDGLYRSLGLEVEPPLDLYARIVSAPGRRPTPP